MGMPIINSSNISRCQSVSDIIQSVALVQAALAHILNAEGEKIQRVVEDAESFDEILAVNQSVNSVVNSVTMLEIVLKSKLALFEGCLCEDSLTAAVSDTALTFINPGDRDAEIIKNNKDNYCVLLGDDSDLPVSMLFSTAPGLAVRAADLPDGVTFQNNIIVVSGSQADGGQIVLEVGEGSCSETVMIGIDIGLL